MGFRVDTLGLLACPFCAGPLRLESVLEESAAGVEYGRLGCPGCGFPYPIVAGVAIIGGPNECLDIKRETTADTLIRGPRVSELADRLDADDKVGALAGLLNPTSLHGDLFPRLLDGAEPSTGRVTPGPPAAARHVNRLLGGRWHQLRKLAGARAAQVALRRARARLADYIMRESENLTALDLLDLFYRRYSGVETFPYFAYRFGQPRHLAALALGSVLDRFDGPLLDLACGAGHLTHYFTSSRPDRTVVAADRDFFRLFVASHHVAPGATYLCVPADQALPFASGVFDGVFCSDAFHYFLRRAQSVREMKRVLTAAGALVVARFGNAAVEPREGYELDLPGYRGLFADVPAVFAGEDALLARYLQRRGPDPDGEDDATLAEQKWLSMIALQDGTKLDRNATFDKFPHAAGRLQLNPIYEVKECGSSGDLDLRFAFPSEWYRFENHAYLRYAPEHCRVSAEVVTALATGAPHPDLPDLIAQCVVVGMPDRYQATA